MLGMSGHLCVLLIVFVCMCVLLIDRSMCVGVCY